MKKSWIFNLDFTRLKYDALANKIIKYSKGTSKGNELACSDNEDSIFEDSSSSRDKSEVGVHMIKKICPQSSHILIKLVINTNFVLKKLPCLNSGTNRNYIVKGLIPINNLQKGSLRLYSETGERIYINYKLSNSHICYDGICLSNDFIITKNIKEEINLTIPFTLI